MASAQIRGATAAGTNGESKMRFYIVTHLEALPERVFCDIISGVVSVFLGTLAQRETSWRKMLNDRKHEMKKCDWS